MTRSTVAYSGIRQVAKAVHIDRRGWERIRKTLPSLERALVLSSFVKADSSVCLRKKHSTDWDEVHDEVKILDHIWEDVGSDRITGCLDACQYIWVQIE